MQSNEVPLSIFIQNLIFFRLEVCPQLRFVKFPNGATLAHCVEITAMEMGQDWKVTGKVLRPVHWLRQPKSDDAPHRQPAQLVFLQIQ